VWFDFGVRRLAAALDFLSMLRVGIRNRLRKAKETKAAASRRTPKWNQICAVRHRGVEHDYE
jgi:outer membrane murein-binding lipoprotein Lpp